MFIVTFVIGLKTMRVAKKGIADTSSVELGLFNLTLELPEC